MPKDGVSRKPYISADYRQNPTENYPQENNKISTGKTGIFCCFPVDNVDNYLPSRFSPIFTTSPAPIVINRSPFMQFSNKKFSISSKEGK